MFRALLLAGLALFVCGAVRADGFETEDLRIPMAGAEPDGLEAVIVRPHGAGRHPLALVSHGSPRNASERPELSARGMMPQLVEFARRGFVAASVLRRGYGTSGGGWAEGFGPCDRPDYVSGARAAAADLRAAITVLSRRDDVDAATILAVGVSAGGIATVALTADPPPGLHAAISFAGGRGSQGPDSVCKEDALVAAFRTFGERSRIPMLWVYAENDHFFRPVLARQFYEAFSAAGGRAEFVPVAPSGSEGHLLFSGEGRQIWTPIIDAFLRREHLASPGGNGTSGKPSLDAPPHLGGNGRKDFETFLNSATHKAFAVSRSGGYAWRTGRRTVEEATAAATSQCEAVSHTACDLYAIDDAYARRR